MNWGEAQFCISFHGDINNYIYIRAAKSEIIVPQHLMLSHHGKAELGTVLEPMCTEIQILTYLDGLDSHVEIYGAHL